MVQVYPISISVIIYIYIIYIYIVLYSHPGVDRIQFRRGGYFF